MSINRQTRYIKIEIHLPMSFPDDWDDDMIRFHLNESSWCADNIIDELEKYSEEHGCICGVCKFDTIANNEEAMCDSQNEYL